MPSDRECDIATRHVKVFDLFFPEQQDCLDVDCLLSTYQYLESVTLVGLHQLVTFVQALGVVRHFDGT